MSGPIVAWALLVVVWALVLDSWDPADLLVGGVLAVAVLLVLRLSALPRPKSHGPSLGTQAVAILPLIAATLRDITVGTWRVALIVLGARRLTKPGIVAVPFGDRTPRGVAVSSFFITLAPGETLVGIDEERREMFVHVVDGSDPDAIRAQFEHFYQHHQRKVWP